MAHRDRVTKVDQASSITNDGAEDETLSTKEDSGPNREREYHKNMGNETRDAGVEVPGIESWLGPWWKQRDKLHALFSQSMMDFKPIQIRNFLKRKKALALHRLVACAPFCRCLCVNVTNKSTSGHASSAL